MICENCKADVTYIVIHDKELWCSPCHQKTKWPRNAAPMISTDDIPGGYEVRHGICNPDGTPRKYYSKSEIRRAASEKGLTIQGETPKLLPHVKERIHKEDEDRIKVSGPK